MNEIAKIKSKPDSNAQTKITGTHIAYYFICARKLWLFDHNIQCEHDSDLVRMGKHIHKRSYRRHQKDKEIAIDSTIVLDRLDRQKGIVHEVKKSRKMKKSHAWQLRYYLWYLEQKGLNVADETTTEEYPNDPDRRGLIGQLDYPKLKENETIVLTQEDRKTLENDILPAIRRIVRRPTPPGTIEWKVCKRCSYCELCYS